MLLVVQRLSVGFDRRHGARKPTLAGRPTGTLGAAMGAVCIIGAGRRESPPVRCSTRAASHSIASKGSGVGGNWRYDNDNGMSSAYRSLFINTSRRMMEYASYPMPSAYPDYPHHVRSPATSTTTWTTSASGTGSASTPRSRRWRPSPADAGRCRSTTGPERPTTRQSANGHHWNPKYPEPPFPGQDSSRASSSLPLVPRARRALPADQRAGAGDRQLRDRHRRRDVPLLGHDLPGHAAGRLRNPQVPPRRATDELASGAMSRLPFWATRAMLRVVLRQAQGKMENYGLPTPDHKLGEAHPTISSDLLPRIGHGRIQVKPNIQRIDCRRVLFVTGPARTSTRSCGAPATRSPSRSWPST